jgi:hypothetical protein
VFFSFDGGGVKSVCPGAALVYVHMGWIGGVPHGNNAHLFVLPIDVHEEMVPTFFSTAQCGEAFHGPGVQDVAEFDSG